MLLLTIIDMLVSRSDFPSLNSNNWGVKVTPGKREPGATLNHQKASSVRPVEYALSSSPAGGLSVAKRRVSATKHSGRSLS